MKSSIVILISVCILIISGCEDKKDMNKDIMVAPVIIKIDNDCTNILAKYHDAYVNGNKQEASKYLLEHDQCVDNHINNTKL